MREDTRIADAVVAWVATGALLASFAAAAQFPGGGTSGAHSRGGGMMGRNAEAPASGGISLAVPDVVKSRLADLREDLKLTAAQVPAWEAYSDKVMRLLSDVGRIDANAPPREGTAPQRLDRIADIARNRLTAVEDIAEAGKALYEVLTPEQRTIADARLALPVQPMLATGGGTRAMERRGASARPQ